VFVVLRSESRRSFRSTAVGERHGVGSVHEVATLCEEGDHLPVTGLVWPFVVGDAYEKERSWSRSRLPTGHWTLALTKTRLDSEQGQQWVVERERAFEIADANKDV
jgi:hypothetical protein